MAACRGDELGGRCDEALAFYKRALGAEVPFLMRFDESPDPMPPGAVPPGFEKKVMHASMQIGPSTVYVSDGCAEGTTFAGFSLSLALGSVGEAERKFAALTEGGTVTMPLGETFFATRFGSVTDRFGLSWMVMVEKPAAPVSSRAA